MSYEHGTTHYNLPLTEGSDKRDWFDTNQAFTDIDAAIYSASEAASAASADVAVITSDLSALTTRVTDSEADIDNLEATQSTQGEQMILLANEVSTIETRTGNKFNSVAVKDAYSPTSTYSVGNYVTYDGNLYECDVAITTGEPFDADKWHAVDLMTIIEGGGAGVAASDVSVAPISGMVASNAQAAITELHNADGNLTLLETTAKDNLVNAINEVRQLAMAAGVTSVALRGTASIPDYGSQGRDIVIDFSSTFTTLVSCAPAVKISGAYCTIRSQTVDTVAKTCTVHVTNSSDTSQSCTIEVTGFGIV